MIKSSIKWLTMTYAFCLITLLMMAGYGLSIGVQSVKQLIPVNTSLNTILIWLAKTIGVGAIIFGAICTLFYFLMTKYGTVKKLVDSYTLFFVITAIGFFYGQVAWAGLDSLLTEYSNLTTITYILAILCVISEIIVIGKKYKDTELDDEQKNVLENNQGADIGE